MAEMQTLPCPFCGGQPLRKEVTFWTGMRSDLIRVEYQHWCEPTSPRFKTYIKADGVTDQEALDAWNRRAAIAWLPNDSGNGDDGGR